MRANEWLRPAITRRELKIDAITAGALALGAATTSLLYARTGMFEHPAPGWLWALGLALCSLPLALRRVAPVPVAAVVAIGFFVCGQFGVPEALMVNICLFLALYSVGAWEPRRDLARASQVIIGSGMVLWLVLSLIIASSDAESYPGFSRAGLFSAYATFAVLQIITNLLYFGAAYVFGLRAWNSARAQALLSAQATELELERRTSAAQAVALDRLEIARELHDAVAHHVSVMAVHAAAARRVISHDRDAAAQSLATIEFSARSAVDELRELVHTLRTAENETANDAIGISQLQTLLEESRLSGVRTDLIIVGEPHPLPMLVDVALYRVVQEALTNVRKHAGERATAEVRLRYAPHSVEVEISDNGVGRGTRRASSGSGLGLRGMRERIGAVGGTVLAEPRSGRDESPTTGWLVRATVPLAVADPAHSQPRAEVSA